MDAMPTSSAHLYPRQVIKTRCTSDTSCNHAICLISPQTAGRHIWLHTSRCVPRNTPQVMQGAITSALATLRPCLSKCSTGVLVSNSVHTLPLTVQYGSMYVHVWEQPRLSTAIVRGYWLNHHLHHRTMYVNLNDDRNEYECRKTAEKMRGIGVEARGPEGQKTDVESLCPRRQYVVPISSISYSAIH